MTIIVGITSPDGVVLASESRTTHAEHGGHRIISNTAQKVFDIGSFGVAMTGHAYIAGNTIAGLMDQFLAQLKKELSDFDVFTRSLGDFFDARFSEWTKNAGVHWDPYERGFAVTFLVAGYDVNGIGHIRELRIPGPEWGRMDFPTTVYRGTIWRGQTDVISRLLKGIDQRHRLPVHELPDNARDAIEHSLRQLEYIPILPFTVQDAIDYASFLIRATIDMQRFSDGTVGQPGLIPGCGGPLQILVVERNRTHWATKPELHVG